MEQLRRKWLNTVPPYGRIAIRPYGGTEKTNLKRIEPHRLKELIYEDLKNYPQSSIGEINERIGDDIPRRTLTAMIGKMLEESTITKSGKKKGTLYFIDKNQ